MTDARPFPKLSLRRMPAVLLQMAYRMRLDLTAMALMCALAGLIESNQPLAQMLRMEESSLTTLGIAVSVFVAFRNTQAITRWWESRILWGTIVNQSRHWRDTLQCLLLSRPDATAQQQQLISLQVLLCWLLNFELRGHRRSDATPAAARLARSAGLTAESSLQEALRQRAVAIAELYRHGLINDLGRDALLRSSETFTTAVGGLQRIRNTPIPAAYDIFIRLICWFYGYSQFLNFYSRSDLAEGLVLFLGFVTAERVGAYVENPFALSGSCFCIPMNVICGTISADLLGLHEPLAKLPISNDPSRWS